MSDDECGHQRMVAHCWGCYRKDLAALLVRAQTAETELARKEEALRKGRWLVEHGCSEWREGEPEDFEWNEVAGAFLADPSTSPQPTPTKEPTR